MISTYTNKTSLALFPSNQSIEATFSLFLKEFSCYKKRKNGSWKIIPKRNSNTSSPKSILLTFNGPGYENMGALMLVPDVNYIQVIFEPNPHKYLLAPTSKRDILFLFSNFNLFIRSKFNHLFRDITFHNLFNEWLPKDVTSDRSSQFSHLEFILLSPNYQKNVPNEIISDIMNLKPDPTELFSLWKAESYPFKSDIPYIQVEPYGIILDHPDFKNYGYLRLSQAFDYIVVDYVSPYAFQKKFKYHASFILSFFALYFNQKFHNYPHLSSIYNL
ncbi:MAG: hypothetical protein J1E16_10805 [Muribaculaceae bacterium]|nr:hypothetical protein [Muribaculaceae bacterium]